MDKAAIKYKVSSILDSLRDWRDDLTDRIVDYTYHTILLGTPKEFKWTYKHCRRELAQVSLRYGVEEIARIDFERKTVVISSDYSSATFLFDEGMPLFRIQRKIFKWILMDGGNKKLGIKGFMLLNYSRHCEIRQEARNLTYEYQWLLRDNHMWLVKGLDEVIVHVYDGPESTVFQYKDQPAKEIEHYNEDTFKEYIESCERRGLRKA